MIADLHCHTKLSDGSTGLEDLISIARRRRARCIAITDHDTMAGCTRAIRLGERHGIRVIHGVEFSCYDYERGNKVHMLCYRAQKPDRLEGLCKMIGDRRKKAAVEMIKKTMELYPITPEQVVKCASGSTNIYKQHIMLALMDAGYSVSMFSELYGELFSSHGSCVVEIEYPDVHEVIRQIHEAGGIAVMAHPPAYKGYELLEELCQNRLIEGVEAWNPKHTEEDIKKITQIGEHYDLILTGGSDFHGMNTKRATPLMTCTTPDAQIKRLLDYKVDIK